jgi:hypothetical protein
MVFECVEIWRGILIDYKLLKKFINASSTDPYEIYDLIQQFNENETKHEIYKLIKMTPCCSNNKDLLLGYKLQSYDRLRINNKFAHCSKILYDDIFRNIQKCGDRIVCDDCLNKTTNGSYPIIEIYETPTECTSWCFICNKDKCDTSHIQNNEILTTKDLIDDLFIREICHNYDIKHEIKNYYKIDDCITCT